jgi:hypothetical protein
LRLLRALFETYQLFRDLFRLNRKQKLDLPASYVNDAQRIARHVTWTSAAELPVPPDCDASVGKPGQMYYNALDSTVWTLIALWIATRKTASAFYDTEEVYLRFVEILPQFDFYNLQRGHPTLDGVHMECYEATNKSIKSLAVLIFLGQLQDGVQRISM